MSNLYQQLIAVLTSFLNLTGIFYTGPKPLPPPHGKHNALFVFGDSLFDPGNNQYLNVTDESPSDPTKWPYGETFFNHPTGRLSDGRVVPDFIAEFAELPVLSPYLQPGPKRFIHGTNFASAGAGVLDETNAGTSIPLRKQLGYFKQVIKSLTKQLGNKEARNLLERAVYLLSIGGNDYAIYSNSYPNATLTQQIQEVQIVIANLTSVLKGIYNLGGRKIAFQNVGPLGCAPIVKQLDPALGDNCSELASALARLHNQYLATALSNLETELPGFKYSNFDYYNALLDRINNASKYGLKEGKVACCGTGTYMAIGCGEGINDTASFQVCINPWEFVWFDGAHTTQSANYQLAQLLWTGKPNVTGPYNIFQLFEL